MKLSAVTDILTQIVQFHLKIIGTHMRYIFIFFTSLLITACAPAVIYKYGETNASHMEVGVVTGPHHIHINSIDNITDLKRPDCTGPICTKGFEIYFTPGPHELMVSLATGNEKAGPLTLRFNIEPGKQYEFVSETSKEGLFKQFWVPKIIDNNGNIISTIDEHKES